MFQVFSILYSSYPFHKGPQNSQRVLKVARPLSIKDIGIKDEKKMTLRLVKKCKTYIVSEQLSEQRYR